MEFPEVIYYASVYTCIDGIITRIPVGFQDESDFMLEVTSLGEDTESSLEAFRKRLEDAFRFTDSDSVTVVFDFEDEDEVSDAGDTDDESESYDTDIIDDDQ